MNIGQDKSKNPSLARLGDTVVIVVHYRNYDLIASTVQQIVDQGFDAQNVLLVDTSEEPDRRKDLETSVVNLCRVLFIANDGYGSAVNLALDFWSRELTSEPAFVLVATHEVRPRPLAVNRLRQALVNDETAGAAGPTLISGGSAEHIWSQGGKLSPILRIPQHYGHRDPFVAAELEVNPEIRSWLDGAFVLYRFRDLQFHRFDESYFMYMEETDLHLRLAASGHPILWVPLAVVWQSSNGTPNYLFARNLRLLYRRSGHRSLGAIAAPFAIAMRSARNVVRGGGLSPLRDLGRGLIARLPEPRGARNPSVVHVVNPLGGALAHYTLELLDLLKSDGVNARAFSLLEPSFSKSSRLRWLQNYVRALNSARKARTPTTKLIVTWPVLGYLDLIIVGIVYGRGASVLMHDPQPLVKAVGYGTVSRTCARPFLRRVALVVHSDVAGAVVEAQNMGRNTSKLPHPIFAPEPKTESEVVPNVLPVVRVLGQFKPDRDLNALKEIGEHLGGKMTLEVWGRGWPQIAGWNVTEGFVSEAVLHELTRTADAVVIPYTRFFQSGIAIRCLEVGTPVIGTRDGSLAELLGADSKLLVDTDGAEHADGWLASVRWAVNGGRHDIGRIALSARSNALKLWADWAAVVKDVLGSNE